MNQDNDQEFAAMPDAERQRALLALRGVVYAILLLRLKAAQHGGHLPGSQRFSLN